MFYRKTYVNNYLSIKVCTNSRKILTLVDNFLDFCATRQKIPAKMKFIFYINETVLASRRKNINLIGKTRIDKDGKLLSAIASAIATIQVKPDRNIVEATVFEFKEVCKEDILNIILMKPLQYLLARQGLFFLHASLVRKNADCILIVGEPNAGKSTIALTLFRSGFDILSDDKCFLRMLGDEIRVFPFPSKMGLCEAAFKNHPYLAKQVLKGYLYGGKRRISLCSLSTHSSSYINLKCKMIIFPFYDAKREVKIRKISTVKALDILTKSNFHLYSHYASKKIAAGNFWTLYNLVQKTNAFKLTYHDKGLSRVPELVEKIFHD